MEIVKRFAFSYGHMLPSHTGKCHWLHGHNVDLHVTVGGLPHINRASSEYGMVTDFGNLKDIVNEKVVKVLDHHFLYQDVQQAREWPIELLNVATMAKGLFAESQSRDRFRDELGVDDAADTAIDSFLKALDRLNIPEAWTGTCMVGVPTTAECLSLWAFNELIGAIPDELGPGVKLMQIQWFETDGNSAIANAYDLKAAYFNSILDPAQMSAQVARELEDVA